MSAPGITTRDYEKKAVQAFTAATAPRAVEYGPFPALIDGVTYVSDGASNDSFPAGWVLSAPSNIVASASKAGGAFAYAGDAKAFVAWRKPSSGNVEGYRISIGGNTYTVSGGDTTQFTVTGLTNGTAYTATVIPFGGAGEGTAVASNSVTPSARNASLDISGLVLDLDPAKLGGSLIAANDSSGIGNHFDITSNPPSFTASAINSVPGLTFNGTTNRLPATLFTTADGTRNGKPCLAPGNTQFLVAQFTGTFTSANFKPWTNQSSALGSMYNGWDFNNGFLRNADNNGGATSLDVVPGALTASTTYIISLTRPGNFYINGAKKTQRVRAEPTQPLQNYVLGCRQNAAGTYTNFSSMVCGRVIAFNRVLTQAERWAVEAYLGTTFGVSVVQQ